jgi:hypothetical protein
MVASFDRPDDEDVKQFWLRVVHQCGAGSSGGIVTLSGWLTAFCWWSSDGKRATNYSDEDLDRFAYIGGEDGYQRLVLDGVEFPVIQRTKIPTGVVSVPMTFYQEGPDPVKGSLLAGSMGMHVVVDDDDETTVQPASGWWLFTSNPTPKRPATERGGDKEKISPSDIISPVDTSRSNNDSEAWELGTSKERDGDRGEGYKEGGDCLRLERRQSSM